jgi:hypothetical protein
MTEILPPAVVADMAGRGRTPTNANLPALVASHEALRAALDRLLAVADRVAAVPAGSARCPDVGRAVAMAEADLSGALEEAEGLRVALSRVRP